MAKNLTTSVFKIRTTESLQDFVPEFDYNNYVYIRGTRKGYQAVASKFNKILVAQEKNVQTAGQRAVERYFESMRAVAMAKNASILDIDQVSKLFTNDWQINWGKAWAEGLSSYIKEIVTNVGNTDQEPISATIEQVNSIVAQGVKASTQTENSAIDQLSEAITNLKKFYDALSPDVQLNIVGVLNPGQLPNGAVISYKKLGTVLETMRKYIEDIETKMGNLTDSATSYKDILTRARKDLSTTLGSAGEWLLAYILLRGEPALEKALNDSLAQNGKIEKIEIDKMQHLGSASPTQTGSSISSRSKPDEVISCTVTIDGKKLKLQIGISQKETGNIIYDPEEKKWKVKEDEDKKHKAPTIKIFDTVNFWRMIQLAFPSQLTIAMENAILNTTLWTGAAAKGNKIIRQSIIAHLIDQFLAGGGTELKNSLGAYDIVDCILINGVAVPIYKILLKIEEEYKTKGNTNKISITYTGLAEQRDAWVGDRNVKSLKHGVTRSDGVIEFMKSMQTIVNMKANLLVELMNG